AHARARTARGLAEGLDPRVRDLLQEAAGRLIAALAPLHALRRAGEEELLHRARHGDVAEAALLLDPALVPRRRRMGEDALLESDQEDGRELEPLRRMHRHQRDAVLAILVAVEIRDQRDLIEVELELRPRLALELVLVRGVEVAGAREELAQVVEPGLGLGRVLLLERAQVARLREDLGDQVL